MGLLPLTPTSKITKVSFRCCYALHSYKRTTFIDSKRTKASSRWRYVLHSYVRTTSLTPVKTRRLYLDALRAAYLCGTTTSDTIKNTKVSFRCFTRHIVMWDYFHWQRKHKGFIQMLLCVAQLCEDYFHWHQQEHQGFINPFTSPACKISRLKSAHIHASKQYIWWSYNKSTLNTVHFDSFLNWTFSSPNMIRTVRRNLLRSQLACNEMQASTRTCGRRAAGSMIENVG